MTDETKWRVGKKVGRTVYIGDDPGDLVGVMDTPELAARVVAAVNAVEATLPSPRVAWPSANPPPPGSVITSRGGALSPEEQARRLPPPPAELVGALQDRLPVAPGRLLASTPIAVPPSADALLAGLGPNERAVALEVLAQTAARLRAGAAQYGPLSLATDARDWVAEANEEALDGAVYHAMERIKRRRKEAP
jgi:hypothetical protein